MSRPGDLKYDPCSGLPWTSSVPIQADTYRSLYPKRVWWTNPWTGVGRPVADVNDNPYMENVPAPPIDESCAAEGAFIACTAREVGHRIEVVNRIEVGGATYLWSDALGDEGLRRARDYLDMLIKMRKPNGS